MYILKTMKKIYLVHDNVNFIGGGERLIKHFEKKFQTIFFFFNIHPKYKKYYLKSYSLVSIEKNSFYNKILSIVYFFLLPILFKKKFKSKLKNIVYSGNFSFFSNFLMKKNFKHIYYCHTPPKFLKFEKTYFKKFNKFQKFVIKTFSSIFTSFFKKFLKRCDYIVANSEFTKKRLESYAEKKIYVIHPPSTFLPKYKIKYSDYFLSNSRLDNHKNIETIIYSFKNLKSKNLILTNDGPLMPKIEQYILDYHLKNIFIYNYLDDYQYSDLLANCLSVIYLAKDEDFGMGVLEAMKYKKGPIVYNSGNLKYFVKDKFNGRILYRLNPSGLENIIQSTTRKKFIYYGKNAFQFAKKNYPNNFLYEINKLI